MSETKKKRIPFYSAWWFWTIIIILCVVFLVSSTNGSNELKNGIYQVGVDIPAGEYIIYSNGMSYFQVSKDDTGDLESIITNDNFVSHTYIYLRDGQYIEIKGSTMLPLDDASNFLAINSKLTAGMYKIGRDIPAGEYKIVSEGDYAYYEIAKDSSCTPESIVVNDNFEGEKYVAVKDGQYIKLTNCYLVVD